MPKSGYDEIAAEYYNPGHITSRNFDVATINAIKKLGMKYEGGKVLELGAGKGRAIEYLSVPCEQLVQLDNSDAMLSLEDREPCSLKVLGDACQIPLASGQFRLVVGFLADPFFGLDCLAESHRMLGDDGTVLFTLPAHEWATCLRGLIQIDVMTTRFKKLDSQKQVVLPSLVHTEGKINEMLVFAGFKDIEITHHSLPQGHLPVSKDISLAAKACGISEYAMSVISTVKAIK